MKYDHPKRLLKKISVLLGICAFFFFLIFFPANHLDTSGKDNYPFLEIQKRESPVEFAQTARTSFQNFSARALYFGTATAFGSAYVLARAGWAASLISPWSANIANECLFLSDLLGTISKHFFLQSFKGSPHLVQSSINNGIPLSHYSWHLNHLLLSQIPTSSEEDKELVHFLEKRWLAKTAGFYSLIVNWVAPSFGISFQVHPESTSSYARNPWNKFSQTYKNRMNAWKYFLPHPQTFPLILTRPFDLQSYLPTLLEVAKEETVRTTLDKLSLLTPPPGSKILIDLTHAFPSEVLGREGWLRAWKDYQATFSKACEERHLNKSDFICIQRVQQAGVGGVRLLPFDEYSSDRRELDHQYLLEWISTLGLTANRIELDRYSRRAPIKQMQNVIPISVKSLSKDEFAASLHSFEENLPQHPQKSLMLQGTLQVLKGLLSNLSEDKWDEIIHCPTRSGIAHLSFSRIHEELSVLSRVQEKISFFDMATYLEQVHASLSSLLQIFLPFTFEDFPAIYQSVLPSIPESLQPLTSCAVHSSGMTSISGIFAALKKTLGTSPRVLYGENSYFECINSSKWFSNTTPIGEATDKDWKEVDLILAQFNPALKRIDLQTTEYKVEQIATVLHRTFDARKDKPLTLAIDCTLDYIDSPRIGKLLDEFQEMIQSGMLNIVCYRSGIKFDLFGMDNYSGAPLYMIHNKDPRWAPFDSLLTDPALLTDQLSLNWFCLAYKSAFKELELYRKQVFHNTRQLLRKVPERLLCNESANYRIMPIEDAADPAFLDIKVKGPLHQLRGATFVAGTLSVKCLEEKLPIFYRPSLGFYHPNLSVLFTENVTTIRLTLGLDPDQVDLLAECFTKIDALNDKSFVPFF